MKLAEAAVYNRVIQGVDGVLRRPPYAFRRARGADMHLSVPTDFAPEHLAANRFAYVASLHIEGAFHMVPHQALIDAPMRAGADRYIVRFPEAWLEGRRFRARLTGPEGRRVSTPRGITRGLPSGGEARGRSRGETREHSEGESSLRFNGYSTSIEFSSWWGRWWRRGERGRPLRKRTGYCWRMRMM